jgi:FkbM family methyltransferase
MKYFACIVIRDGEQTIARTILSLLNQRIKPLKIIVVNDGSTDNTGAIIEKYRKNHPDLIEVINTDSKTRDHSRLPRLRTEAIEYAQTHGCGDCEFFMTTGGDCDFEPRYAEKILLVMQNDPNLVIASGDYGNMSSISPHGAGRFVRASFFKEYRKKQELRAWQESELKMRAIFGGYRITVVKDAVFEHLDKLGHSHNFTGSGRSMKALGYSRLFVLKEVAKALLSRSRVSNAGSLRLLRSYITYRPEKQGYYSSCEPEFRRAVAKMQREMIVRALAARLKRRVRNVFTPSKNRDTLLLPVKFYHKFRSSGVMGELAYVELDNGRKLYGYKSRKYVVRFYNSIADRSPATLTAHTYGCAVDVAYRYLRDLPYPRRFLPSRGGTIAEIGAYLGHKTIKFVDDVVGNEGKVLAVEMMPDNFAILERNMQENNVRNVTLKNVGVWNERQIKDVVGAGQQQNSLVTLDERQSFVSRGSIQTDTLDNILGEWDVPVIDFLNIRVNGAEIEVLQGLNAKLANVKVIFVAAQYSREGQQVKIKVKELLEQKECKIMHEDSEGIYAVTKQYTQMGQFYNE